MNDEFPAVLIRPSTIRWFIRKYQELPEYGPALKTCYSPPVLQFFNGAEWLDIPMEYGE